MKTKLYKKVDTQKFSIDGGTVGFIYPSHPKGQHTIVRVSMNGKYPVVGYSVNSKCTETIMMLEGSFRVRVNNEVQKIKEGDVLVILPRTKYRIEGKGECLDIITPSWNKKQNKIIVDKTFIIKP